MGFSLAVESGDRSVAVCRLPVASYVVQHRLSGPWASVVRACHLECGPRSCGVWAWLLQGMRDLPGPGIELLFPALQGRFFTRGQNPDIYFLLIVYFGLLTGFKAKHSERL